MTKIPTETILQDWRYGQTQSERLCAELLYVEGFQNIDPQSPLGGPDGRKDILCNRDGKKWVGASYFPPTRKEYKDIKEKFEHDLEGVSKNEADGIVFFVNQPLSPGERTELIGLAEPALSEVYHLERIRAILDSPKGYGLRLEFLRIPMTEEEQLGFWSILKDEITARFLRHEATILDLHRKMDALMERTTAALPITTSEPSRLTHPDLSSPLDLINFPTASLSIGQLLWIHRLLTDDSRLPYAHRGHFRSIGVWIGKPGGKPEEARYVPPSPDEIYPLTEKLLEKWRNIYPELIHCDAEKKIYEVSNFHHEFLSIHPFLDANGRVARAILQQQAMELLNRKVTAKFTEDPAVYYDVLTQADDGDLSKLTNLIKACLE